jgi:hypothetical protein
VKIRQREEEATPSPVAVLNATGDVEVLTRRVAALESLAASLLWFAVARGERRPE